MATVSLIKAHAYGNDFLLVHAADAERAGDVADLARRLCARHTGIGADGLMLTSPTSTGAAMRLLNADGSPSEISGNGIRCVAAWLTRRRNLAPGTTVVVDTEAGARAIEILGRDHGRVLCRADMGAPSGVQQVSLDIEGEHVDCVVLNMGNPQCVVLGPRESLTQSRLHRVGAALAIHPYFPAGTNVELAAVVAADLVEMLIWERGVGPTRSSGTGTCAAAVAATRFGGADPILTVSAPGGTQRVEVAADRVWLTGAAEVVAQIEWWGER